MDTKKLRQKILDLAIRGKLVPQDPNDEPASVLLERIRTEKERLIKEGKIKRSKKSASDDEIEAPFEIPESWIACKLEDIAYIGTGATPDTRNNNYYNGNIPWVSSSCTKYDYIDTPTSYITQKAIDETNCRIYPKGTLIMAMYGEGKTRGQISELKIDAATNQACAAIVPYNISTAQYIKLFLKRSYLHIREQAEGGTQPNLNLSKIAQYDIYLPPLSEQNRIVNEVERWFNLIDELESNEGDLLKAIDKAKSKILDLAIHGKLVPQDPNDEPAIDLLKRINPKFEPCDSDQFRNLPFNWQVCSVKDVFQINPKINISDDLDAAFVPMANIEDQYNNKFVFESRKWGDIKRGYTHFQDGDIAVAKISPCLENRKSVVFEDLPNGIGAGTTELNIFRSEIVNPLFGLYFFKSNHFISNCVGTFNGVVGQQRVATKIVEDINFFLPPLNEQKRIVAKIKELFAVLDNIKESLE